MEYTGISKYFYKKEECSFRFVKKPTLSQQMTIVEDVVTGVINDINGYHPILFDYFLATSIIGNLTDIELPESFITSSEIITESNLLNILKGHISYIEEIADAARKEIEFIKQKEAHNDFGYMNNVDRTAYNIVPPNSFAYNPARINVGSLGYYTGVENVIVSSLYEVFQTNDYLNDRFLWHWLKSDFFPVWIERLQEGSVRLYFYFDKLIQCKLMMPSLEEQIQIGIYLDSLDNLITLHQRL